MKFLAFTSLLVCLSNAAFANCPTGGETVIFCTGKPDVDSTKSNESIRFYVCDDGGKYSAVLETTSSSKDLIKGATGSMSYDKTTYRFRSSLGSIKITTGMGSTSIELKDTPAAQARANKIVFNTLGDMNRGKENSHPDKCVSYEI